MYVYVLAIFILQAKRMRRVIFSPVACLAPQNFALRYKRHDFGKNFIEYKMCLLIFSTTYIGNFLSF